MSSTSSGEPGATIGKGMPLWSVTWVRNMRMASVVDNPIRPNTLSASFLRALKKEAERVLGRIGLSTTEAIRMFLTQVTLHKGIPFPIVAPGSPLDVDDIVHPVEKRNAALDLIDED